LAWNLLRPKRSRSKRSLPSGRRIYAIGDIHGRAELLSSLCARIDEDLEARPTREPIQVLLGDYIDRGSNTREVIEMLIARRRQQNLVLLKGNHEECALEFLRDPSTLSQWKSIGGLDTLRSYGITPARSDDEKSQRDAALALRKSMPKSHLGFLEGLALSFSSGDFFFVHAGVRPGVPLREQSQHDLLWIRDEFLLHEEDFGKVVVHGHTPSHEPQIRANRINIDTGAYATDRLTCLVLENDRMGFL
jgi:serine/threonine protein phosphatase 1